MKGIAYPEIILIVDLTHVDLLQLIEEFKVIEDLRIGAVSDVLFILEEDFEVAAFLLAFGAGSWPLFDDFFGLADWGLHEKGGVMRGRDV